MAREAPTDKSCYILQFSVEPGGARRADRMVYRRREHILELVRREFLGGSAQEHAQLADLVLDYGMTMMVWVVQHGQVTVALDLHGFASVRIAGGAPLRLEDPAARERWQTRDRRRGVAFEVDLDALAAAMPALQEPLLAPGEVTGVWFRKGFDEAVARQIASIIHDRKGRVCFGYTDLEGGAPPADDWVDPDPATDDEAFFRGNPSDRALRARARGALAENDLKSARRAIAMLEEDGDADPPFALRAELQLAEGRPWSALIDAVWAEVTGEKGPRVAVRRKIEAASAAAPDGDAACLDTLVDVVTRHHERDAVKTMCKQLRALAGPVLAAQIDLYAGTYADDRLLARAIAGAHDPTAAAAGFVLGVRERKANISAARDAWRAAILRAPGSVWLSLVLGESLGAASPTGLKVLLRAGANAAARKRDPADVQIGKLMYRMQDELIEVHIRAADGLVKKGQVDAADRLFVHGGKHAVANSDRWRARYGLAALRTDGSDRAAAIAACTAAIDTWKPAVGWISGMRTACRFWRACHLAATGEHAAALADLEAVIGEDPGYKTNARKHRDFAALAGDPTFVRITTSRSTAARDASPTA
jgi:hypothetical protein